VAGHNVWVFGLSLTMDMGTRDNSQRRSRDPHLLAEGVQTVLCFWRQNRVILQHGGHVVLFVHFVIYIPSSISLDTIEQHNLGSSGLEPARVPRY
jgi:hypothetical protein